MRFIPTRTHGIIDYIMGILLIAAPWLFDFARDGAETWIPVILGIGTIIYSLITDYEVSATRKLSMSAHLGIDVVAGIFLAASPWLFDFADFVYLPHLILGIAEVGVALMTQRVPSYRNTHHGDNGAHSDRNVNRENSVRREKERERTHL